MGRSYWNKCFLSQNNEQILIKSCTGRCTLNVVCLVILILVRTAQL
jgi:hypothetical protein